MINDLNGNGSIQRHADIAIIGGGTVGLLLASKLSRLGLSVICLESGGMRQDDETHPLNEVVQTQSLYSGASEGRFRCLGGTSTRWGGALIPFLLSDVRNAGWPIEHAEMLKYLSDVEEIFGLKNNSYDISDILTSGQHDHIARLAKWPPFFKRNVFNLLSADLKSNNGASIWIHSTVTEFGFEAEALNHVIAKSPDKSTIRVQAKEFIVAAGAIESTRLLLMLEEENGELAKNKHLGRYFQDHLSVAVADLQVIDRVALNKLAGFRFETQGVMRNLRFELSESTNIRESVAPCFAHISFNDGKSSAFGALRELFRMVQRRSLPSFAVIRSLVTNIPWLLRTLWWRLVHKRLLYPSHVDIQVHMVIEQAPCYENRIRLSKERRDIVGVPLTQIGWSVRQADLDNLANAVHVFERTWNTSNLASIANFNRRATTQINSELANGGGVYHPVGTTRIGTSTNDGVVNRDLQVFGYTNLRVVSTSVFPTGGGSNPTMMLLMLGLRCVEQLRSKFASPRSDLT